jgi:hypothetical protein
VYELYSLDIISGIRQRRASSFRKYVAKSNISSSSVAVFPNLYDYQIEKVSYIFNEKAS